MLAFLKLIRLPNLIVIALSQLLVRYCLIIPAFQAQYNNTEIFPAHLNKFEFCLLVFSTILIAAAGYIINDVFDVSIDEINKPGKNIIGKKISEKSATGIFYIFSAIGILIGIYLAFKINKPVMAFVNLFVAGSLWMYSSYYKKRLLLGNIIIAILSSLSLLIIGLFEPEFYLNITYLLIYCVFAVALSLVREIIKDIEDIVGDELAQCKTIPILVGIKWTKFILITLIVFTAVLIGRILFVYFYDNTVISYWNLLAIFEIPFVALAYLVVTAQEKKDYHFASLFTKIMMVLGIFTLFPFYYFFLRG